MVLSTDEFIEYATTEYVTREMERYEGPVGVHSEGWKNGLISVVDPSLKSFGVTERSVTLPVGDQSYSGGELVVIGVEYAAHLDPRTLELEPMRKQGIIQRGV